MATAPPLTPTEADARDLADRYAAMWNDRRVDGLGELVTGDVVWFDPALPRLARGVREVQSFMRASLRAFPDLRFGEPDPPHLSVSEDQIAWAWTMEGTMTGPMDPPGFAATGRSMYVEGIDLWTLRDGRIARYGAYYDTTGLARQLGIVPLAGSGAERATVALQRLRARFGRR